MNNQDEMFDYAISTCREHVKPVVQNASQWCISPEQRGGGWAIECDSHGVIAVAIQRDKHPLSGKEVTWDEAAYNARLMASARTMLEALQMLVEAADDSNSAQYGTLSGLFVRQVAEAAIRKATGAP
jgi:hypothetical protein